MQHNDNELKSLIQQVMQQHICTLDLEMSMKIAQRCLDKAKELKVNVSISICNKHGNAILFYGMPDALLVSTDLAFKKAHTSVSLNMATHEAKDFLDKQFHHLDTATPGLVFFGGGFPVYIDGQLVGGIGVSGGTVAQDMEIAKYGLC